MARPITWLATAGAKKNAAGDPLAGGKVYAFVPGTTTQTPIWSDKDQTSILTQPITLDAQGRYQTLFTEGPVDLNFYDEDGTFVYEIERANAQHATEVELENGYWIGVNPNGTTGVGGRTSLDAMATRIGESTGGADAKFKHTTGGTERALNVVVSELGLSVKSKGALGNDSANDTQAFKDAIAAIKSEGGGTIIIPEGIYRIDDELIIDFSGLSIIGAGNAATTIKSTVTNKHIFNVSSANNLLIQGMILTCTGTSTVSAIYGTGITALVAYVALDRISIRNFQIGIETASEFDDLFIRDSDIRPPNGSSIGMKLTGDAFFVRVQNTKFTNGGAGSQGISIQGSSHDIVIDGCLFLCPTAVEIPNAGDTINDVWLVNCDLSNCSTAAWNIVQTAAMRFHPHNNRLGNSPTVEAYSVEIVPAATITFDSRYMYSVTASGTAIDHIRLNHLYKHRPVTLFFPGASTLNHNTGGAPAGFVPILLAGGAPFASTANDILMLQVNPAGTAYVEVGRTLI